MQHQFKLKFKLAAESNLDEIVERLGAVGCTDALVGIGMAGHVSLAFCRVAVSFEVAILEATADVRAALPGAEIIAVEPESPTGLRIGIATGAFEVPDDVDASNDEVTAQLCGSSTALPKAEAVRGDALLTIVEAAERLRVGRPVASMLADAGKLGEVVTAEDGSDRIGVAKTTYKRVRKT